MITFEGCYLKKRQPSIIQKEHKTFCLGKEASSILIFSERALKIYPKLELAGRVNLLFKTVVPKPPWFTMLSCLYYLIKEFQKRKLCNIPANYVFVTLKKH